MNARVDQTPDVTHFHEHAEWTGVHDNDRESWLALRRSLITASDMAAILGEDKHRDALSVYVDKTTERIAPEEILINDPRFWGKVLEQTILTVVAAYYDWEYQRGGALLRSRRYPYLGCTLDAEICRESPIWVPLEGKTSVITRDWNEDEQDLPIKVQIQVQHQLLITGAPYAYVFALLQGSRPCLVRVEPNPAFHAHIIDAGAAFIERVERLDPPPPTALSRKPLEQLYGSSDGSIVDLPVEAVSWTRQIDEITQETKRLETLKEELKNNIRSSIGSATFGRLPEPVGKKKYWRWHESWREPYIVQHEGKMQWGLYLLNEATMPKSSSTGSVEISKPEDLAEGEAATRLRGRRRARR